MTVSSTDDLDFAMLDLPGVPATEAAAAGRRALGERVADRARARYARRYFGRRWDRVAQARRRHAARRQQAALVESIAALLMGEARPTDLADARDLARLALARAGL